MRVLVVEDNQAVAFFLQSILEKQGHEVRLAAEGTEGYNTCHAFRPDMVITEVAAPGKTGIQMMGLIRDQDSPGKAVDTNPEPDRFEPMIEQERKKVPVAFLKTPFSNLEFIGALSKFTRKSVRGPVPPWAG